MAAISSGGIFVKVIGFGFKILCFNKFTRQDSLSAISIADAKTLFRAENFLTQIALLCCG
jgi:hypothetical protein